MTCKICNTEGSQGYIFMIDDILNPKNIICDKCIKTKQAKQDDPVFVITKLQSEAMKKWQNNVLNEMGYGLKPKVTCLKFEDVEHLSIKEMIEIMEKTEDKIYDKFYK